MRQTLWEQMSAIENGRDSLAGLTLDAVLGTDKRQTSSALAPNRSQVNRTLLDIIRDEESNKDKKSWKAFRERLRLKRAGAAWTSSFQIPASDIPIHNNNNNNSRRHHQQQHQHHNSNNQRSFIARRNSVRFTTVSTHNPGESAQPEDFGDSVSSSRPMVARFGNPSQDMDDSGPNIHAVGDMQQLGSFRPQMSRHNSTRFPPPGSELDGEVEVQGGVAREGTRRLAVALAEERQLSAREAVAAQEAAEAAAAAEGVGDEEGGNSGAGQPVRMSLMDLLEETDRQMGFEGSRYIDSYEGEEEGEYEEDNNNNNNNGIGIGITEHTCCVCMVRHKGAAFIPCGHTFCRLCSRELWAQRGNCPLCNGFILEILHIF